MSNALIWGSSLILVGFSLIFKTLFGISIPIVRPLVGAFLLYAGFMMIINPHGSYRTPENTITFSSRTMHPSTATESYHTAFGSGTIDLTHIDLKKPPVSMAVNTAFGSTKLIIRRRVPTRIKLSTSFSYALMPDGSTHSLGEYVYNTSNRAPELIINVNLAFANLEVIEV